MLTIVVNYLVQKITDLSLFALIVHNASCYDAVKLDGIGLHLHSQVRGQSMLTWTSKAKSVAWFSISFYFVDIIIFATRSAWSNYVHIFEFNKMTQDLIVLL